MTKIDSAAVEAMLDTFPKRYPGPGGVAGVMKDGRIVALRAWGYANTETGQEMTRQTRLPICSISKQFTCGVLLAEIGDPARLDGRVAEYLPNFTGTLPTVRQMCDMQSGLRDYWALTVLQGAMAEQEFRREDAMPLIARMKTGHFAPGSRYSYCNCNFRILSELIESETGQPLDSLYRKHIWGPAGMARAVLTSDTRYPEDGVVGYEGSAATGFFPAENAVFWIGDAGISASLDDMLAYEAWIDATREDGGSLYRRLSVTPSFADGAKAAYGYGLMFDAIAGQWISGHAGALRGFRARRMNARAARLSVVVMFNHEADTHSAASDLIKAALGQKDAAPAPLSDGWDGQWMAPETRMVARITSGRTSARLDYGTGADMLALAPDGALANPGVTIRRTGDGRIVMARAGDNWTQTLAPLPPLDAADGDEIEGRYHSGELEAEMEIAARDGGVYARFHGMLGQGRMERMAPVGKDVWTLATRRSMDAPAPGDWTFVVRRDVAGRVTGGTLGCWLAHGIGYDRT